MVRKATKVENNSKPLLRLVRLINVMSSGQKRAFKRDATFWRDKKEAAYYVQMFDEICKYAIKLPTESKKNLLELLLRKSEKRPSVDEVNGTANLVTLQNISVRANYLYDKILETMRFVTTRSKTFKDLNGRMQDVYFLFNNDLTDDCLRLIKETLKLAEDIDRPAYVLELSALERRILFTKGNESNSDERLEIIIRLENKASQHLLLYNRLTLLNNQLMKLRTLKSTFPSELEKEIEEIMITYQREESVNSLGVRTRFQIFVMISEYCKMMASFSMESAFEKTSINYGNKLYYLLKTEPTFKEDEYSMYQIRVSAYLIDLVKNKKFEEAERELSELEQTDDKLFQCKTLAYIRIQIYNEQDRYLDAFKYITDIKLASGLRLYNSQIWPSRIITLCFLGAYVSVMVKSYLDAGKWAKMIAQDSRFKIAPHLRLPVPFIQTLAMFELDPKKTEEDLNDFLTKALKNLTKRYSEDSLKTFVVFANKLKIIFLEFIREKKLRERLTNQTRENLLAKAKELYPETKLNPSLEPFRIPVAWLLSHLNNSEISDEMK